MSAFSTPSTARSAPRYPIRGRIVRGVCAGVTLALIIAGCDIPRHWGGGRHGDAGDLPPVQESEIVSLSQPDNRALPPQERGGGMINPDKPHLVVLRDANDRILRIWVGGRRSGDPVAIACVEALYRLADKPAAQRQRIPSICNRLPNRDVRPG